MKKLVLSALALLTLATICQAGIPDNEGNLRYSITVSTFKNKAGWRGQWSIGDGFASILTDALQQSGWFIVLGDKEMRVEAMAEQDFAASGRVAGGKKAPQIGRMTPAQLLVKGEITHVQSSTTGGKGRFSFKGISLGGSKDSAEVNITMYVVDSETGQVAASTKLVGKSGRKGLSVGYHGSKLGGLRGDLAGFKKDNVGKACEDAVGQGLEFLVEQLEDIPWEGSIMMANGSKIIMNRGSREGVVEGTEFAIGEVEELVDEDTGEVLDSEMTTVATAKAGNVKEKITYLTPLSGADKIKKGMSVFPAEE
jgi:curli biogenesis system outer membrane secretion channel CsgG